MVNFFSLNLIRALKKSMKDRYMISSDDILLFRFAIKTTKSPNNLVETYFLCTFAVNDILCYHTSIQVAIPQRGY